MKVEKNTKHTVTMIDKLIPTISIITAIKTE
jgi:hypothetical protein